MAVSIVHPGNPLHRLEMRGVATVVEDSDRSFIDKMAHKYIGSETYPLPEPGVVRVIVSIVPDRYSTFM